MATAVSCSANRDYFSVAEFHIRHPEQVARSKKFAKIVQDVGQPIEPGVQNHPVRIAFIYPGQQISDYWRRSIASFKSRMDEIAIRYEVFEHFSKPAVEIRLQEQQLRAALQQDPDYLVFTLDAKKHQRVIERILTKGRPKLILQNITTPLRSWESKQPFLYDGFDHATGAIMLAQYYLKHTRGNGDYAMLFYAQGYVSHMRGDTFIDYMRKHSKLTLVSSYYTDGNREKSKQATLDILREHPEIKFLYACSTDTAIGAIDALRQTSKLGQIMVNGWGGGSSELKAILAGEMDVTVMRMNDDNGVAMAEAIRLDLEGRHKQIPIVYSGNFTLIEKGMSKEKLRRLKTRAFRYSDKNP
jgi:autoinducer 2-binding protein LuxP